MRCVASPICCCSTPIAASTSARVTVSCGVVNTGGGAIEVLAASMTSVSFAVPLPYALVIQRSGTLGSIHVPFYYEVIWTALALTWRLDAAHHGVSEIR